MGSNRWAHALQGGEVDSWRPFSAGAHLLLPGKGFPSFDAYVCHVVKSVDSLVHRA